MSNKRMKEGKDLEEFLQTRSLFLRSVRYNKINLFPGDDDGATSKKMKLASDDGSRVLAVISSGRASTTSPPASAASRSQPASFSPPSITTRAVSQRACLLSYGPSDSTKKITICPRTARPPVKTYQKPKKPAALSSSGPVTDKSTSTPPPTEIHGTAELSTSAIDLSLSSGTTAPSFSQSSLQGITVVPSSCTSLPETEGLNSNIACSVGCSTSQPATIPDVASLAVPSKNTNRNKLTTTGLFGALSTSGGTYHSWTHEVITPSDLQELKVHGRSSKVLLVDCRAESAYEKERICSFPGVNVPSLTGSVEAGASCLTTKLVIVKFLQDHCPKLLAVLNKPGFYTQVVVFDERSRAEKCSQLVVSVLNVVRKWNEDTPTKTLLLNKGFLMFLKEEPGMVGQPADANILPWNLSGVINEESFLIAAKHSKAVPLDTTQIRFHELVLKKLEEVTRVTGQLLRTQKALNSLEGIKSFVQEQERSNLDIPIPYLMKCPVCFGMFLENIYQCTDGHNICHSCVEDLAYCPECRTPYNVGSTKIRSLALEQIRDTWLHADCPFLYKGCSEKLSYNQLNTHVKNCEYGKSSTVRKLEQDINCLQKEFQSTTQKLVTVTKDLIETETAYKLKDATDSFVTTTAAAQQFADTIFIKKLVLLNINKALDFENLVNKIQSV